MDRHERSNGKSRVRVFHFQVSRLRKPATDEVFFKFISRQKEQLTSYQLSYLAFDKVIADPARAIQDIFRNYNLIGVMERFDESVVVLQMILGLETEDVLYLTAKGSGGYDDGRFRNKCTLIKTSFVSPAMQEYFESGEWQRIIHWDVVLHRLANHALDMRIEQLGRLQFERNLARFRAAKRIVDQLCGPTAKLPCTSMGELRAANETDCVYYDMGCGFKCMDSLSIM